MIKMMILMVLADPIVAFEMTKHRVTAEDAARYARHYDEFDFAIKIAMHINDQELREKRGAYGRRRIEEQLVWHHHENTLLQVRVNMGFEVARKTEFSAAKVERETVTISDHWTG